VGAAARTLAHSAAPARPRLRVVTGGHRRTRTRSAAAASQALTIAVVCIAVLAAAGVVRVFLAASAAEASIDAWELKAELKAAEAVTRMLETDKSSLAAPSRIEAVACQTLNMARPAQVAYLQLPSGTEAYIPPDAAAGEIAPAPGAAAGDNARELLATLMDLAAGEAQVLLVGDVGLGSLR